MAMAQMVVIQMESKTELTHEEVQAKIKEYQVVRTHPPRTTKYCAKYCEGGWSRRDAGEGAHALQP